MERWEKEYLEALAEEKAGKDGYGLASFARRNNRIRRISIASLAVFIVLACLPLLPDALDRLDANRAMAGELLGLESGASLKAPAIEPGELDPERTYVDGAGFRGMMDALGRSEQAVAAVVNEWNRAFDGMNAETLRSLRANIAARKDEFSILSFHESYRDVVQSYYDCLCLCEYALDYIEAGAGHDPAYAVLLQVDELKSGWKDLLIAAFDANGIEYEEGEDGSIRYSYRSSY